MHSNAVGCMTNVGIMLAILLAERLPMTLVRQRFGHRPNIIDNGWVNVCQTPLAQQIMNMHCQ